MKGKRKMIICLTQKEIIENPYITEYREYKFYQLVAEKILGNKNFEVVDCAKINVSKYINDMWFEYAKEHDISENALAMNILIQGPKALSKLADNEVEILEEAIK